MSTDGEQLSAVTGNVDTVDTVVANVGKACRTIIACSEMMCPSRGLMPEYEEIVARSERDLESLRETLSLMLQNGLCGPDADVVSDAQSICRLADSVLAPPPYEAKRRSASPCGTEATLGPLSGAKADEEDSDESDELELDTETIVSSLAKSLVPLREATTAFALKQAIRSGYADTDKVEKTKEHLELYFKHLLDSQNELRRIEGLTGSSLQDEMQTTKELLRELKPWTVDYDTLNTTSPPKGLTATHLNMIHSLQGFMGTDWVDSAVAAPPTKETRELIYGWATPWVRTLTICRSKQFHWAKLRRRIADYDKSNNSNEEMAAPMSNLDASLSECDGGGDKSSFNTIRERFIAPCVRADERTVVDAVEDFGHTALQHIQPYLQLSAPTSCTVPPDISAKHPELVPFLERIAPQSWDLEQR